MQDRLQAIETRYEELNRMMEEPGLFSDPARYTRLAKEHAELAPLVALLQARRQVLSELAGHREWLADGSDESDPDFRALVRDEVDALERRSEALEREIRERLVPRDPRDERSVILEIRAGTGGEEAALFAGSLYRMYTLYADAHGFQVDLLDSNPTELGGFREAVLAIEGRGAYSRLKYESGVHRVQRVPVTESGGRIHTSTVTVAVLPEAEEVEVAINPADLEIDTYRASGAGGQYVNKTESAIRITHRPTGLVVTCQDQRSQYKNRERAMTILRARLLEREQERVVGRIASERKSQVGTGDRSERIRTYNFPQGRMTDHRIGLTLYRLESILNGDLDEIVDALTTADRAQALGQGQGDGRERDTGD